MSASSSSKYQLLPHCSTHTKDLIIVAACDGASSTGQIGNEVERRLTKRYPGMVRMCCLSAVAAKSKTHVDIFQNAKAVIAKEGINKLPSLDFTDEGVAKIADKTVNEFLSRFSAK
jgi:uncharacterized metal-binding protein